MRTVRTPDERFEGVPDFPYAPRYAEDLPGYAGLRLAYLDEGPQDAASVFLCLHGQPTWSFLFRKMIPPLLAAGGRVVAPDFLGFGRSDKPVEDAVYTFDFHRDALRALIAELDLRHVTLVVQDWGGLLGLTLPVDDGIRPRIERLLVMNTGLATGRPAGPGFEAWRAYAGSTDDLPIGPLLSRAQPGLTPEEAAAYEAPFVDKTFKAGVRQFPKIVMTEPDMPGVEVSRRAAEFWCTEWSGPTFMAAGALDPVFDVDHMRRLAASINGCPPPLVIEDAGHFVQERGDVVAAAALAHFGDPTTAGLRTGSARLEETSMTQRAYEFVGYEQQGPVVTITFDRPERMNAIGPVMSAELVKAWDRFRTDDSAKVAVLTGRGSEAFCAGGDLKSGLDGTPVVPVTAEEQAAHARGERPGILGPSRWTDLYKPTIAAVNGAAYAGGLEWACWTDIAIADAHATFGVTCRRWNIGLADGGTQRLPRIVGWRRAMELIITGRVIDAEEAQRIGLINEVVASGRALARAQELAAQVAALPQPAIHTDKEAAIRGFDLPLAEGLRVEAQLFNRLIGSPEMAEGLRRFTERDHPDRDPDGEAATQGIARPRAAS